MGTYLQYRNILFEPSRYESWKKNRISINDVTSIFIQHKTNGIIIFCFTLVKNAYLYCIRNTYSNTFIKNIYSNKKKIKLFHKKKSRCPNTFKILYYYVFWFFDTKIVKNKYIKINFETLWYGCFNINIFNFISV